MGPFGYQTTTPTFSFVFASSLTPVRVDIVVPKPLQIFSEKISSGLLYQLTSRPLSNLASIAFQPLEGGKVPRPFGPAVHRTSANDLLQFDYIGIAKAHSGEKYVLILRDDHSNYCWLYACPETSAEHAARAIKDWSAAFGVPNQQMSDGPTHFTNEVLGLVAKGLRVPHHFTLPYSPWSNGAVERLGKELLRVFRSVVSELRLDHGEWPDLLPLVQSALNNAPSPQRANVSPVKAMTGLEPSLPIRTFYRSSSLKSIMLNELESERALIVEKLAQLVCELHPAVQDSLQRKREDGRKSASKGNLPNFMEGDFVLVARE